MHMCKAHDSMVEEQSYRRGQGEPAAAVQDILDTPAAAAAAAAAAVIATTAAARQQQHTLSRWSKTCRLVSVSCV